MTPRRLDRIAITPALRVAATCVVVALVGDLVLVARLAGSPDAASDVPLRLAPPPAIVPRAPDAKAPLSAAAAHDPFEPLGTPQPLASAKVVQQATAAAGQPRLVGTVVRGAESFVVMAMPEGTIKVVRVGERAGDLRLRSVSAGGAVFDDLNGGERITLRAPTPGAEPQP